MTRYCRRSEIVEAEQFWPERQPWPAGVYAVEPTGDPYQDQDRYCVDTTFGTVYVRPGDWIVTTPAGRQVFEAAAFDLTFEECAHSLRSVADASPATVAAMERVSAAYKRGGRPDPADIAHLRAFFDRRCL